MQHSFAKKREGSLRDRAMLTCFARILKDDGGIKATLYFGFSLVELIPVIR